MHIDGYIVPVPESKKQAYLDLARWFDRRMHEFGAIEIMECWEKDIPDGKRTDFRKAVLAEPDERIVLSWIIWPDKATAEAAHEKIHDDPEFAAMADIPFDGRRMVFGAFEPLLSVGRS